MRQALVAIIVFILFVAAFIGLVALSTSLPITGDQRAFLWVGGFLFVLFLTVILLIIWASYQARRRAVQLDSAFAPYGLSRRGYLWNGRQYHGVYQGRQVDVYLSRGPTLDIYLGSAIRTRMGIGPKGRLSQFTSTMINRPALATNDPELLAFGIYPLDDAWARNLLGDGRSRAEIVRLAQAGPGLEFRNLIFQPEAVHLQVHRVNLEMLTQPTVSAWMADLLDLARTAEALPAPSLTADASPMERRMRLNRGEFFLPLAGITCAVIGFFAIILIIVTLVFFRIGPSG